MLICAIIKEHFNTPQDIYIYGEQSTSKYADLSALEKVRNAVFGKGYSTIRSLAICFKHFDDIDGNRMLQKAELQEGLKSFGLNLNKGEIESVFKAYDKNGDGSINYDEFLVGMRGNPNTKRQAVIDSAFKKMDKDGSKVIAVEDMKGIYTASSHPEVKAGKKSEDQIFKEFLQGLGDKNSDGKISTLEWNDYYAGVSASMDNDDHFVELMKACWKL